jgi:hypothetical protein
VKYNLHVTTYGKPSLSIPFLNSGVQLTSTLFNGDIAYEGQQVNFTCIITSQEDFLTWSGDHYIDQPLQIGFHDEPGHQEPSLQHPSTVATLVNATTNGGVIVIESQLRITASIQYPNSSVSCQIDDKGEMSTITFRKLFGVGGDQKLEWQHKFFCTVFM